MKLKTLFHFSVNTRTMNIGLNVAQNGLSRIKNTQYIASMNPTAGSFFVDPRLQRWFWIVAIPFPESSSLNTIFAAFLNKHFSKFKGTI